MKLYLKTFACVVFLPVLLSTSSRADDAADFFAKGSITASDAAKSLSEDKNRRSLGELTIGELLPILGEAGESRLSSLLRSADRERNVTSVLSVRDTPAYLETAQAYGYIGQIGDNPGDLMPITEAALITPETELKGKRIRVSLDYLGAFDYPGEGQHKVMFDFYGRNIIPGLTGASEELHFQQQYKVQEGSSAGVVGYPVFTGLNVSNQGVLFWGSTVNVSNPDDEKLLGMLDNNVFKQGMTLLNGVNPLAPMITSVATNITTQIVARKRSKEVQQFYMGLDFERSATGARLRQGSYIVCQHNPHVPVDWSQWEYNPNTRGIQSKASATRILPHNYVIFRVSQLEDTHAPEVTPTSIVNPTPGVAP